MIKPTMNHAVDINHLNHLLVKYYEKLEKSQKDAPFYQWFDDLFTDEQKTIIRLMNGCGLSSSPREYESAVDVLIDIERVTYF